MKIKTLFAFVIIVIVLISSMSTRAFMVENGIVTKIAEPFRPIARKLLGTMNFPVYLPTYLPSPFQENKWHLNLDLNKNNFMIEIDQLTLGERTGTGFYAGTLSGNVENPQGSPIVDQLINENKEIKTIYLADGIEGKEYFMDLDAYRLISWKIGQWSYFVAARPDKTRSYASEIIKNIGTKGLGLSDSSGKLYFLDIGANHPTAEIFWKVNDFVWYQLDWRDNPSEAIKILQSMKGFF